MKGGIENSGHVFTDFMGSPSQSPHRHHSLGLEADRRKSEMLRISLLVATAQLSRAVAMAIKRGSPNGEIEEGLEQYNMAMEEFREFEREQIVKNQ